MTNSVLIIGVDEAGRGPLAGPVTAGAVILNPQRPIDGLKDSKQLSAKQREELAPLIREHALAWAVASVEVEEIDRINILQATLLAMHKALQAIRLPLAHIGIRCHLQVDGNRLPRYTGLAFECTAEAIIDGDVLVPSISAASILAKTSRDALMMELHQRYPAYGFASHKGYCTRAHLQALRTHGPTPMHRRSFAPVRELLDEPL